MRVISNILWIILGGLIIAIGWALIGLVLCVTIIGIPLGLQAFKMAGLTLTPFGKTVRYGGGVGSTLANIIWVVLVGFWMALSYVGAGLLNGKNGGLLDPTGTATRAEAAAILARFCQNFAE